MYQAALEALLHLDLLAASRHGLSDSSHFTSETMRLIWMNRLPHVMQLGSGWNRIGALISRLSALAVLLVFGQMWVWGGCGISPGKGPER